MDNAEVIAKSNDQPGKEMNTDSAAENSPDSVQEDNAAETASDLASSFAHIGGSAARPGDT